MKAVEALQLSQDVQEGLDFIANHDIKAAAYPVLVQEGPLTTSGLANALMLRVGVYTTSVKGYPDTYVQGGFATIEDGSPHRGVPRRLFRATRADLGLAVTGAMLDWSEVHNIPLIRALSTTSSQGSRAPVNTIQLLKGMLDGANIGEIANSRYKKTKEGWDTHHNERLKKLVAEGFVEAVDTDPDFRILDPEYKGSTPFHMLAPNQQHIYTILSIAKDQQTNPNQRWKLSEIESLAATLLEFDTPQERSDFHERLVRVISSATPRYSPGVTDKVEIAGRRYTIAPHFVDAAADLVERAIQLDESPTKRLEFRDRAHDITRSSGALRNIVNRGVHASPFINAQR